MCPSFETPWTAEHQASLFFTIPQNLLKSMSIGSVMASSHLVPCHPLLPLPSIFPSIRVFSNESALRIRWPKYWSFSFSISPSNEHSGLISFRVVWLDLLAIRKQQQQQKNNPTNNHLHLIHTLHGTKGFHLDSLINPLNNTWVHIYPHF